MKSAAFEAIFRESALGVSRYLQKVSISLRSLLGQSCRSRTISQARQTPLSVGKVLALYSTRSKCGWYRGIMYFRPESSWIRDFYFV